jgi:uncharacterized protein
MSVDAEPMVPTMLDSEPAPPELELAPEAPVRVRAEPVRADERVTTVDMLRGFALLGILAMNIVGFAWPGAAYGNPTRGGGFSGIDRVIWVFNHLVFEMKMMTLFSMLFGAGLVLMGDRADSRGASLRGVYYRRCLWLLVIGLIHAYLIWWGDILVLYAECGLLIYLLRKFRPRTLIALGILFMALLAPLVMGFAAGYDYLKETAAKAEKAEKAGKQPTRFQAWIYHDVWIKKMVPKLDPNAPKKAEEFAKEIKIHREGYAGIVKHRAKRLIFEQTLGFIFGGFFLAGGRMLVGMGLMKLGVFAGTRSKWFYIGLMVFGYGIGVPLVAYDAFGSIRSSFGFEYEIHGGIFYNLYGSVLVALGHVGALVLVFQAGLLTWLTRRLAAVGRMALSNYLTHSIVCTTLFYGYGFGLFGKLPRWELALIVLAIWVAQLWYSPIWLERFRFGPAEWLWRSLTYWKLQPMRRQVDVAAA